MAAAATRARPTANNGPGVSRRRFIGQAGAMVAFGAMLPGWMSTARVSGAAPLEQQAISTTYRVAGLPFDTAAGAAHGTAAWDAVFGKMRRTV